MLDSWCMKKIVQTNAGIDIAKKHTRAHQKLTSHEKINSFQKPIEQNNLYKLKKKDLYIK